LKAGNCFQERTLAGSVLAHESHTLSTIHHKADVAKQGASAELNSKVIDTNQNAVLFSYEGTKVQKLPVWQTLRPIP
jgi:hypothetical protein